MLRLILVTLLTAPLARPAAAQEPAPVPAGLYPELTAGPPPGPPVPDGLPPRGPPPDPCPPPAAVGQQHWVAVQTSILQPTVARLQVKVWPRPNNSLWAEVYAGSVLFDALYGAGVRVMHTARTNDRGDALLLNPGLGVHVIPGSGSGWFSRGHGTQTYLAADVDIGWLHDFGNHFGFELGLKVGIAGRVAGSGPGPARGLMFGHDCYPILAVYSGFRF